MNQPDSELLEKIRQQFDSAPYPRVPLDAVPTGRYPGLYIHSLATPHYIRYQEVVDFTDKVILDAGCGTGYKSHILAIANPGAKIVGIDLSAESVDLSQKRLAHHGIQNAEFHVLAIQDLPKLGLEFDYINCDDVLYLFPDIGEALSVMKSVLKPRGFIRGNLHSTLQRFNYFRAQQLFQQMGLMDTNPEDMEIDIAVETIKSLKDGVDIKAKTWNPKKAEGENRQEWVLMNYLFQGDKGYTIPDLFAALDRAGLEFVSMVDWRSWELMELFNEAENLPVFWQMCLPELTIEQRLHVYDLMNPVHRLLDFWCTHPGSTSRQLPIHEWQRVHWENATVHLHPVLRCQAVLDDLTAAVAQLRPFVITEYLPDLTHSKISLDISMASCLLPLWEGGQRVETLVDRWLNVRPVNLATLEPIMREQAFEQVTSFLASLEIPTYLLLETSV